MVRMVAITASLEMSSQVGATAVRTRSAARAEFEREQDPGCEPDPDLPAAHLIGRSSDDAGEDRNERLERAERHDENGTRLDQKRDVVRDLAESFFERNGFDPPNSMRLRLKPAAAQAPIRLLKRLSPCRAA